MALRPGNSLFPLRTVLRRILTGPQMLAFLPALALGAFWTAGEGALVAVALGTPLLVLLSGGFAPLSDTPGGPRDSTTGLPLGAALEDHLETKNETSSSECLRSLFK